ncbi:uncharacterized protein UTRI_03306_B [Ustilago trichophora]|uniref:CCHC-type domain-containing protein n=1 Tax=Ustilago trichophora TaxID=86804 RepID=A0A5C3E7J6_9BASI|nr:uncharacterized protein UTRI_03306_B [Ustilago trichophora]
MPEKILVVGSVSGRLTDLVSKISAIQSKHGPFEALFILGDLFHPDPTQSHLQQQQSDLLEGTLKLPIPTYFYQGTCALPQLVSEKVAEAAKKNVKGVADGLVQLTDNLYYVRGKSGVFVTSSGFRVAFVGGIWDAKHYAAAEGAGKEFDPEEWFETSEQRSADEAVVHITPSTIHRLLAHPSFRLPSASTSSTPTNLAGAGGRPGTLAAARASASQSQAKEAAQTAALSLLTSRPPIDLLLTNCWPTGVTLFSTSTNPADPTGGLPDGTARMWGSPAIARLATHACPRYHFSLGPSSSEAELPVGISEETLEMGAFWERAPYVTSLSSYLPTPPGQGTPQERREVERLKSVTRFVSLAKFANAKKRRWFLALNLTPADEQKGEPATVPGNATQSPYHVPSAREGGGKRQAQGANGGMDMDAGPNFRFSEPKQKRQRGEGNDNNDVPPPGYVCRICNVEGHFIRACPSKQAPSASTGSNSLTLASSNTTTVVTVSSNENSGGWTKSTIPLPPGLPSKPTFSTHQKRQLIPVGPTNCWFCLSNPTVAKSLIVTIGAESYLVFPKGPFSHPSINDIPHNASHLLIAPLTHTSNLLPSTHPVLCSTSQQEEDEERRRIQLEMEETKADVRQVWSENGHVMVEWTLVRVRTSSRMTHFQTQMLALFSSVVAEFNLAQQLDDALETLVQRKVLRNRSDIETYFTTTTVTMAGSNIENAEDQQDGYFHLILHDKKRREWLVPLDTSSRFPVQFVRTTLAKLLNLPQLADWKTAQSEQEKQDGEEGEKHRSAGFRALLLSKKS